MECGASGPRSPVGCIAGATLGQSYGGFVTLTYLSRAPEALRACYVTGGLPAIRSTVDDVYALTYQLVAAKNARYYRR
jgi:pimeloyl-ACP methyl ester carboxylesterase